MAFAAVGFKPLDTREILEQGALQMLRSVIGNTFGRILLEQQFL